MTFSILRSFNARYTCIGKYLSINPNAAYDLGSGQECVSSFSRIALSVSLSLHFVGDVCRTLRIVADYRI